MTDPRVEAIRKDKAVGHGTCSSLDECCSDEDIMQDLDKHEIKTPREAVEWARKSERLWLEYGCEQRWGEDGDPQLSALNEFKSLCERNPIEIEETTS